MPGHWSFRDSTRLPWRPIVLSGLLVGCSAFAPPAPLATPPDLTFHRATIEVFKAGVLTHRGVADNLLYTRDNGNIAGQNSVLWPLSGELAGGVLHARTAAGNTKSGEATLSDEVHWVAQSGDQVDTPRCFVDIASNKATGHDGVIMHGEGYAIAANEFESHFGKHRDVLLKGDVHTTMLESKVNTAPDDASQGAP